MRIVEFRVAGTVKDDVKSSWVLEGHRAALDCHDSRGANEGLATVLWYRGTKGGEPIFT